MSKRKGTRITAQFQREDDTDSWLVRQTESPHRKGRDGRDYCTITCELVFGRRKSENGRTSIVGTAYHVLTGPTARKSMDTFAAQLNAKKTPPSEWKKCKADGCRIPKDGGPMQDFLPFTLKPDLR